MISIESRLRRIRKRLLLQVAIALSCNVLLCVALSSIQEPLIIPNWMRIAGVLGLLNFLPLLVVDWMNWKRAKSAVSEMWAFGQFNFDQISRMLVAHKSVAADIENSKPYIDVMHNQIGGSLAESEGEVLAAIEQLNILNAQSSQQSATQTVRQAEVVPGHGVSAHLLTELLLGQPAAR